MNLIVTLIILFLPKQLLHKKIQSFISRPTCNLIIVTTSAFNARLCDINLSCKIRKHSRFID